MINSAIVVKNYYTKNTKKYRVTQSDFSLCNSIFLSVLCGIAKFLQFFLPKIEIIRQSVSFSLNNLGSVGESLIRLSQRGQVGSLRT